MSAGRINATVTDRRYRKSLWIVGFDPVSFQRGAKVREVFVVSGLNRAENVYGGNIRTSESAIVHHLFNARARRRDLRRQIGQATRPIADDGGESAKPAVGYQTTFDHATKDVRINVAAAN